MHRAQGPSSRGSASKKSSAARTPKERRLSDPSEDGATGDSGGGGKRVKGSGGGVYSGRGRPPGSTNFPPAPEIVKGSRVELSWDRATYEAVVLQMGSKDREGHVRVQWAPPGGEKPPEDGAAKEWKSLDELRQTPPDPPKGWLHRLQPFDVIE